MTVPAPERVEKSTAAVQALLRQLLEMYDAKTLANQLVAQDRKSTRLNSSHTN